MSTETPTPKKSATSRPTRLLLRGLAITLPPILTLVILVWIGRMLYDYIVYPTSTAVRYTIAQFIDGSRDSDQFVDWASLPELPYCGRAYRVTPELKEELAEVVRPTDAGRGSGPGDAHELSQRVRARLDHVYVPFGARAVPYADYAEVAARVGASDMPKTALGVYMDLVTTRYFGSLFHLSAVALVVVIVLLYFIGGFVTARVGAWFVGKFETAVLAKLPLVSNVYGSVKQVTDFFLTERTVSYNRVVAVQYPMPGVWTIGFATGDSMLEICELAGEPLVAVLMPTSPMPMTGFTVSVPRSRVHDLNLTMDQAFQFCLSCGVLVPPQQRHSPEILARALSKRLVRKNGVPALEPPRAGETPRPGDGARGRSEATP